MRKVSEKRAGRQWERDLIVQRAFARDRFECHAKNLVSDVECGGRLDPHEVIPRSAWADGIYDIDNVIAVCRRHHDWIKANEPEAHRLGLHGYSHERTDDGNPERHT